MTFPEENNLEVWKTIPGFEDYSASTWGRVRRYTPSLGTYPGKILKPKVNNYGYLSVVLSSKGKNKTCSISRLVAQTFIPNPHNLPEVDHIDNNQKNNHVENLKWSTGLQNTGRSWKEGAHKKLKGSGNANSKLTEKEVFEIKILLKQKILSIEKISKIFNCVPSTIHSIKHGKTWKHVILPTES
jgi:hypothetical protein